MFYGLYLNDFTIKAKRTRRFFSSREIKKNDFFLSGLRDFVVIFFVKNFSILKKDIAGKGQAN
jgi:hypothetical protein